MAWISERGQRKSGNNQCAENAGKKAAAATLRRRSQRFLPTFAAGLAVSDLAAILCATAALLGHMWPVCFRFQGRKGSRPDSGRWPSTGRWGFRAALRGARRTSDETDVLRIDIRCGIFPVFTHIYLSQRLPERWDGNISGRYAWRC